MSTGYYMDDIAIEYREEIEVLRQKDEAHVEARSRMASKIESLTAEVERLSKQSLAWQDEANRLKTLYNLERLKGQ